MSISPKTPMTIFITLLLIRSALALELEDYNAFEGLNFIFKDLLVTKKTKDYITKL